MSSIGKLLSEKLDVLRLTFYTAPVTCIVLLPFYLNLEAAKFTLYESVSSNGYIGEIRELWKEVFLLPICQGG